MTTVEELAAWAAGLALDDVPPDVLERCRAQRRSVLGAVAASAEDGAARRLLDAVERWAGDGPAPLPCHDRAVPVEDVAFASAVLSVALDFDDYLMFGHTGHSAVLVPLLLATETGSSGSEQLVAQVIANEVEARLGAAALLGPMNGQLWAFLHAAGGALAAGRLLGLDTTRLGHALAIALAHPTRTTVPGFMGPDTKALVAAAPVADGIRAARLAATGVSGPLDALDEANGTLDALSYAPLRGLLGGLGRAWTTRTLSVKAVPGCAYLDTLLDALDEIGPLEAGSVDAVEVRASAVTCGMDALAEPSAGRGPPSPVTVTFSVSWSVAVHLLAGRVTEEELREDWLADHLDELRRLRDRVALVHDSELTTVAARAVAPLLPVRAVVGEVGPRRLLDALWRLRREHRGAPLGLADLLRLVPAARERASSVVETARPDASPWWRPEAVDRFRTTFPATVTVRLHDGSERRARADVPAGGAGNAADPPEQAARRKLAAAGPRLFGAAGTRAVDEAVEHDADDIARLMGGSTG